MNSSGFQIELGNLYRISVIFGYATFSSNKFNSNIASFRLTPDSYIDCTDAEVAILKGDKFVTKEVIDQMDGHEILSYDEQTMQMVTPDQLVSIIKFVSELDR
jgi:hypothetical protein